MFYFSFIFSFIVVVATTKIKQQCGIRQSLKYFYCIAWLQLK